jgi:hypothetical protein
MKNFIFFTITILNTLFSYSQGPSNPNNPYDITGESHNRILSLVASNFKNGNFKDINDFQKIFNFIVSNDDPQKNEDNTINNSIYNGVRNCGTNGASEILKGESICSINQYDNQYLSDTVCLHLDKLIKLIKEADKGDNLYNDIVTLEEQIINGKNKLTKQVELKIVLSTTSVARYSTFYWINENGSNWHNPDCETCLNWPCWSCIWNSVREVVTNDVVGAFVGGVSGGAAGAVGGAIFGGPAGGVAGFSAGVSQGVVRGAVAGSVLGAMHR